jgi:hypothetical protein
MPRIPGLLERIQQPLYDRNTVATSGTGQLNYFQVPLGGTAAGAAVAKTQVQTNMDQGGSLPYPKNFEIHAIRLVNQYGSAVVDLSRIYDSSWFRLFIGTKDYLVVNSFMLTAGVGLNGVANGTTNIVSVVNGRGDQRGIYVLAEPIDLIPQQNFRCEINFPTPFTAGAPLLASVDLSVYLDGFFKREVH